MGIVEVLYSTGIIYELRNIKIIAWTTLIFGIVLFIADRNRFDKKISSNLNLQSILFISLFQILSLVPGVSRAGITITAARILRFNRLDSSKISFLLSIPALGGASFLGLKDVFSQSVEFNYLVVIAIAASFIFSFMTVKFFLIYINKFSMNAFDISQWSQSIPIIRGNYPFIICSCNSCGSVPRFHGTV